MNAHVGVDPFDPAILNKVKLFDLLRPADSLFLPSFAFSAFDLNRGHSYPFLAGRLRRPFFAASLKTECERGVIASPSLHKWHGFWAATRLRHPTG